MYPTFNEEKSVVAERFIRTLKNKIFEQMTAVSKNVHYDVLDDIVNNYNNTYHLTIKIKLIDVNLFLMLNTILVQRKKILDFKNFTV